MEVRGLGSMSGAFSVGRVGGAAAPAQTAAPQFVAPQDEVEISSAARMLDAASRTGSVREQRLEQIKAAIAAGTYDTPERLSLAVDRMLSSLAQEVSSS